MKVTKLIEWLWTDYVLFDGQVTQLTGKPSKYICGVCNKEFYSFKKYPVCHRLMCWIKYKGW